MISTEKAVNIIARYFSNTATNEETAALLEWLKQSHDNRIQYFRMKRIWQESKTDAGAQEETIDYAWQRLNNRMKIEAIDQQLSSKNTFLLWKRIAVAASIIFLIGLSGLQTFRYVKLNKIVDNTIEINAPLGSRANITLPDGTDVWLNSGSKLTYNNTFGFNERNVTLIGEAFFDVAHMDRKAFFVNTRGIDIKVLGTEFNVKAYPDEHAIETTVISGEVEVTANQVNQNVEIASMVLKQNQKVIFDTRSLNLKTIDDEIGDAPDSDEAKNIKRGKVIIAHISNPENESSWKDEKLVIRSESLSEMAIKLERFYNVSIVFNDEDAKQHHFTGTLDKLTIEEVLRAIANTAPIEYEVNRNQINIGSKEI